MTDPISDMIIRIKNAYLAKRQELELPHSKVKENIALLLQEKGYVQEVSLKGETAHKVIYIKLKYNEGLPAVTGVKRLSTPGLRNYSRSKKIPATLGGYGLTIVSTSSGLLSDKEAKKKGIGGELLCSIW